jgi:uncharacterized protein
VKTAFQPEFELSDAKRLASELKADLTVIELDIIKETDVTLNPADRCYFCKRAIFSALTARARADGYGLVIDGTNASDDIGDRPGVRALAEFHVRSPLRECGISKADVRALSRSAGLFTWDKPSYSCLATRVPTGTEITPERLSKIERAETALFALGFSDFRVRLFGSSARLVFPEAELPRVLLLRKDILSALKKDFEFVTLDLEAR